MLETAGQPALPAGRLSSGSSQPAGSAGRLTIQGVIGYDQGTLSGWLTSQLAG